MTKARLSSLTLNVSDPEQLAVFYRETLGMHRLDIGDAAVGYGGEGSALILKPSAQDKGYEHRPNDRYWKIAITLPNLDLAHEQLTARGVHSSRPKQFGDIGYMSHLADPEGHVIELIQHSFEGSRRSSDGDAALPLGGGAQIGLITLRTNDIEAELLRCHQSLGMRYLCRQTASDIGFDLYFLALTEDTPPDPDPNALVNREWVYRRPYTVLEFQHRLDGSDIEVRPETANGAAAISIERGDGSLTFLR